MRMITACFAPTLQRDTSRLGMHFLLTSQEVMLISKTRNQLTLTAHMGNLCNMGKVYVRFFVVGLRSSVSVILLEPLWGTMEVRAYNLRVRGEPPWTDTQQHPTSAAERFSPRPARSWSAPRWVDSRPGVKRHSGIQSEA